MGPPCCRAPLTLAVAAALLFIGLIACGSDRGATPPSAPPATVLSAPAPGALHPPDEPQDPAMARAYEAMERGDLGPAHDAFLAAATGGPRGAECLYAAGRASLGMGQADRGRQELDQAIAAVERTTGAPLRAAWAAGFGGWAEGVAFSPNGALIAVTGRPDVVLYDARTLTERVRLGPTRTAEWRGSLAAQLTAIAWSPDGATFAAGTGDQSVLLGDAFTGRRLPSPTTHDRGVTGVAFGADGLFASSGYDATRVVQLADHAEVRTFPRDRGTQEGSVVFLDQGRSLALRHGGGVRIEAVHPDKKDKTRSFGEPPAGASPGDRIEVFAASARTGEIVAGRGPRVQAFAAATGVLAGTWTAAPPGAEIRAIDVSPDGRMVAAGSSFGSLRVFRREGDATLLESAGWNTPYVSFDPTGASLAAAQAVELRVWDLESRSPRVAPRVTYTYAMAVAGSVVALLEEDAVRVWDLGEATVRFFPSLPRASAIALSEDGRLLAVGDHRGGARVVRLDSRAELWAHPGSGDTVASLAFDPAGGRLLVVARHEVARHHHGSSYSSAVTLLDVATGSEVAHLEGAGAPCAGLFSRSGKQAWLLAAYGTIVPVPLTSGPLAGGATQADSRCAFARDPTRDVVALGQRDVVLHDLATGAVVGTLTAAAQTGHLAWSPDGRRVAALSRDGDLQIWTVGDASPATRHVSVAGDPLAVAFSADGSAVLVASWEGGLSRTPVAGGGPALTLFGQKGDEAGFALDATGHVQLFGAAAGVVLCGFGAVSFPFDLCRHRLEKDDLLAQPAGRAP